MVPAKTGTKEVWPMEQYELMHKLGLPFDDSPEVNQQLIIDTVAALHDKVAELNGKLHDLETQVMLSKTNEEAVERRLNAVIRCFGEENIVERMIDDVDTEDVIDLYARRQGIE